MESETEYSADDSSLSDQMNRLSLDQTTMALLARLDEITSAESDSTETDVSDTLSSNKDKIRFHLKTGSLVHLANGARTAERIRPLDEFNNAVVMTHRPLQDDELFEIRIDKMIDKWSGSIEVGITTHNPSTIAFPGTMTNLRSGTIMMSGCGILTNGKGTRREYGHFNLDDLQVGDRIGLIRKSNLDLHYYINGVDQGVAASNVHPFVWGVVDLYGRTVKVTIIEHDDHESANLILRRRLLSQGALSDGRICFHSVCGKYAAVINHGYTVHRPNAKEDFNNGVVLTNRPLKKGELFEVRLDKLVSKWAGSIEIGVTTHKPTELVFPTTMTNVNTGTWMMTGNGVMQNGTTMIDNYGKNLDKLQIGDRVGVLITDNGDLHFFVNGEDQGGLVSNMPDNLYGVVDLYGQAAEATIVESDSFFKVSTCPAPEHWKFHFRHGRNAKITESGTSAMRISPYVEFNDAIVMSEHELKNNEMFCIVVDKIVTQWKGSLKMGVTTLLPQDWEFSQGLVNSEQDTWLLSGSSTLKNGVQLSCTYTLNLDFVAESSVIGILRYSDGSVHYFLNNVDMGCAFINVPQNPYVVIDLYGRCCQISLTNSDLLFDNFVEDLEDDIDLPAYTFHPKAGKNIKLEHRNIVCTRVQDADHGLVFTSKPLMWIAPFEIVIECLDFKSFDRTLRFGLTTLNPHIDPIPQSIRHINHRTWYFDEGEIIENVQFKNVLKEYPDIYGEPDFVWRPVPIGCLERDYFLQKYSAGTHLAIKIYELEQKAFFYVNGEEVGCFINKLPPEPLFGVVDVHGICSKVYIPRPVDDAALLLSTKSDKPEELIEDDSYWWSDVGESYDATCSNFEPTMFASP